MYKSAIVVPKSEITKYAKSSEKQVGDGEKNRYINTPMYC